MALDEWIDSPSPNIAKEGATIIDLASEEGII